MAIKAEFADAIIRNYRLLYKRKYKEEFNGTDSELLTIINDEPVWSSANEQDEYILESMAEFHDGNRINKIGEQS